MSARVNPAVKAAIDALPEKLRAGTLRWFERYAAADLPKTRVRAAALVRVFAASEFAAATVLRESAWLERHPELPGARPDLAALRTFAAATAASDEPVDTVKQQLRRYRNRFLLHALWREVEGLATLDETLASLSALADRMLDAAALYASRQMQPRFGTLRDPDGEAVPLVILGMGKLGGGELNFSSDIDIILLYPRDGQSDGDRALSAAEYFTRLARHLLALLDEVTSDGFVFRVDTRLRPFGESGPPVVSFDALEAYLLQHGRGWERYAYMKARIVGPSPPDSVAAELYNDLILPFVYRRYLDFGIFESLREMHGLIAAEVQRRELADNIKLGPGGIREIEFIVQSLQLVRGGRHPELQSRSLLAVLPKLVGRQGLIAGEADTLAAAYRFLRRLENFIQGINDRQVHELPTGESDQWRLCLAMGFADWESLVTALEKHRHEVTRQFADIALRQDDDEIDKARSQDSAGEHRIEDSAMSRFEDLWEAGGTQSEWSLAFAEAGYPDPDALADAISTFAAANATRRVDSVSAERLQQFVPLLLGALGEREQPGVALQRVLAIVAQVLRRTAYIALLNENRIALHRLVDLCARSAYVAGQISRHPMLLDELLDPRIYSEPVSRGELDAELVRRLQAAGNVGSEQLIELLSQFQQAALFRIAVADFNGNLPIMRVSDSLTDLAELVLTHALEIAWRDMTAKHGVPCYELDGRLCEAGFGIIAYGKFGGIELSYGSDLDLVFLHDSRGDKQLTDGARPLDNAVFFTRLVRRLVHYLTTQTASGMLYEIDTRLRPDGKSGVLVSSVDAFERYQEANAWTWEHQALLRARPVAGSSLIGREFERVRVETLTRRVRRDELLGDVVSMRQRMRAELDSGDAQHFDLKQGSGGIADIEFIVQFLVLANAAQHRSLIHYPDNIRQLGTLAAADCLSEGDATRLQEIYRRYRLRLHHLSLNEQSAVVGDDEFVDERRTVVALWSRYLGT